MSVNIKMDTTVLNRIARDLDKNVEAVCEALAFEIETRAKQFSPYDTGAMSASIYTVTKNSDGYSQAAAAARAANPGVKTHQLPKPERKTVAIVGPSVEYAAFVEFGTSRMGARPFLAPAVQTIFFKFGLPTTWEKVVR